MRSRHIIWLGILLFLLSILGCQPKRFDQEILIDNSLSFDAHTPFTNLKTLKPIEDWLEDSKTGDALGIYAFCSRDKGKLINEIFTYTTPEFEPPVYESRPREIKETVGKALKKFPSDRILHSPILEAIDEIASYHEGNKKPWRLVIFSDLLQTSSDLTLDGNYLRQTDPLKIRKKMLTIAPPPSNPPFEIVVFWTKGWEVVEIKKEVDTANQRKIRSLFEDFFKVWAPKSSLKIKYFAKSAESRR